MENVTVGGLVLITSLTGAGTALTTLLKRRCSSLALLTFSDATFISVLGSMLLARGLDWISVQWTLGVFSAALCHAQHSNLTMVAHACGTRGLKLVALTALSWTVPIIWIFILVALPESCDQNQLVVSLVKKIYSLVQQHNRTRRLFDELNPIWFEEKYDDTDENLYEDEIEQRNISDILTRDEDLNNVSTSTTQVHFPDMNMTLISPTWKQCEGPNVCLVVFLFISYVLPILLISTLHVSRSRNNGHMNMTPRCNVDQVMQCPIPRPRSAPPCVTPRPRVHASRYQISATGKYGLIRALVVVSAVTFAPGLASELLRIQSQTTTKILQLLAISLHAVFKTSVNIRLLAAPAVQPC